MTTTPGGASAIRSAASRPIAATAIVLFCLPAAAQIDSDAVRQTYGERVRQVRATTRDTADDAALARDMLDDAASDTDDRARLAALARGAHELATRASDHELAFKAMELLGLWVDNARVEARLGMADALRMLYRDASPQQRADVGQRLMPVLTEAGEALEEAGREAEAIRLYREGVQIATVRLRTRQRVERLEEQLAEDPTDADAADTLARLCVTGLDEPARAAPHAPLLTDELWRTNVPLAAQQVGAIEDESAALGLADWYRDLAAPAPESVAPVLLRRAHLYYDRYLQIHVTRDDAHADATAQRQLVRDHLRELGVPAPPPPGGPILVRAPGADNTPMLTSGNAALGQALDARDRLDSGRRINLLDFAVTAGDGAPQRLDDGSIELRSTAADAPTALRTPVTFTGGYILRLETLPRGDGTLRILMPVAGSVAELVLPVNRPADAHLTGPGGRTIGNVVPGVDRDVLTRPLTTAQIIVSGGETATHAVEVLLNDDAKLIWSGRADALGVATPVDGHDPRSVAVALTGGGESAPLVVVLRAFTAEPHNGRIDFPAE